MAEAIMNKIAAGRLNTESASAGVYAMNGSSANPEAISVMRENGIDLTNHKSRLLSDIDINDNIVLCMEEETYLSSKRILDTENVYMLCEYAGVPGDIPDPYMQGRKAYEECAKKLFLCMENIVNNGGRHA